jgi:hypothetical protein
MLARRIASAIMAAKIKRRKAGLGALPIAMHQLSIAHFSVLTPL